MIEAAVLEELTDDRTDVEASFVAIWIGNEATHAAHDQVNRDAACRRVIEEADHLGVYEGIHLCRNVWASTASSVFHSGADPLLNCVTQLRGRNQEPLVVGVL